MTSPFTEAKTARRARPSSAHAEIADLKRYLADCMERVEMLQRESDIQLKRMAAMQSEIDQLRAQAGRAGG